MRMWMVDPRYLCKRHLLGEHGELHKHRPSFVKQHSIAGRVQPGAVQIEPLSMAARHRILVTEMLLRECKHDSPYEEPDLSYLPQLHREARVDSAQSVVDLYSRCYMCRERLRPVLLGAFA